MKSVYDPLMRQACEKYLPGVDWRLYKAQLWQESHFNPRAVSSAGAGGIAQFMPQTWAFVAKRAGFPCHGADRFEPEYAIPVGAFYMRDLWDEWSSPRPDADRYCLALASYNAGIGSITKAQVKQGGALMYAEIIAGLHHVTGSKNSSETINYVRKIAAHYAALIVGDTLK